ncbi:MAG TPA: PKD domain-containing protein [Gemmatimonadales bacterium]|nr:PKD domain-containing protein [Gemmatimonadales bacterium]
MPARLKLLPAFIVLGAGCKPSTGVVSPTAPPPPPPANQPPTAVAGGPYTATNGIINVDGSKSSDPEGDSLTYKWDFGDGTSGDSVKMAHTYPNDGTYNVSLVVTDSKNAKSAPSNTTATVARAKGFVLVGAGNIASGDRVSAQTAALIDSIDGTVFTTGDNAFPDGSDTAYANHYANTWGHFLARTRPTLGNHDYIDPNAKGSFDFFGDKLGTSGLGYYSYDLGTWHIIVLNDKGGMDPNYPALDPTQMQWLQADLDAHKNVKCTIAMWHIPLFNSSNDPNWTSSQSHKPIWDVLYAAGVDIVLNGQQHNYERFAPMNPSGVLDTATGIREFNVGTGGESVETVSVIAPNSEAHAAVFGVLKLTLLTDGYNWEFVPVAGSTFTDVGSGTCH